MIPYFLKPISADFKVVLHCLYSNFVSDDDFRTSCQTSLTFINNGPFDVYTHPDDHAQPAYDRKPGFKPFTLVICNSSEEFTV